MGHKWIWPAVLGVIAGVLAGVWALPRLFPGLGWGLDELNQLSGIVSLAVAAVALVMASWWGARSAAPPRKGGYPINMKLTHTQGNVIGKRVSQSQLHLAHQPRDVLGEATARSDLGLALAEGSRFEEAIDAHTRARDLYQQANDAHGEATAWNNLGTALLEARRFEEAIDAHTRANQAFRQVGDIHSEATAWNDLGLALTKSGRQQSSPRPYRFDDTNTATTLLALARQQDFPVATGSVAAGLTDLFLALGPPREADLTSPPSGSMGGR